MIVTLITQETGPAGDRVAWLAKQLDKSRVAYTVVDADSPHGAHLSELYDITTRPAVLVTHDDGVMAHLWQGALPSADELGYSSRS